MNRRMVFGPQFFLINWLGNNFTYGSYQWSIILKAYIQKPNGNYLSLDVLLKIYVFKNLP